MIYNHKPIKNSPRSHFFVIWSEVLHHACARKFFFQCPPKKNFVFKEHGVVDALGVWQGEEEEEAEEVFPSAVMSKKLLLQQAAKNQAGQHHQVFTGVVG